MKTCLKIIALVLFTAALSGHAHAGDAPLSLVFFGSRNCGECLEIKETLLGPLEREYAGRITVTYYDVEDPDGFNRMVEMEARYKVTAPSPQELYFPDTVLLGYDEIMAETRRLVERRLARPARPKAGPEARSDVPQGTPPAREGVPEEVPGGGERAFEGITAPGAPGAGHAESLRTRFEGFSFIGIVAAGLIDGVNPCAIATMIFLISFLATKKKSRREILVIGLCFTAAVFFTYLLLGVGAFKAITALEHYRWLSKSIRWSAVFVAGAVGLASFYDAFRYKKTGDTRAISIQLPEPVKRRIHRVISGNLSGGRLAMGAVATGFLVTLLEAVCTGQVYLPTIVLMTRQEGLKLTGWLYLVMYNFLFVLPLIIVMTLAYFGLKWDALARATQKRLSLIKVAFGVVLIALAAFLAVAG